MLRPRALVLVALAAAGGALAFTLLRSDTAGRPSAALAPEAGRRTPAPDMRDAAALRLEAAGGAAADLRTRGAATPAAVAPIAGTSDLTVRAVDAVTGAPIAAFYARATPGAALAQGKAGAAVLTGLAPGPTTLEVQGPEHEATVHTVELPLDRPVILRLAQRPGLRGEVRFADARPAADVVLRLVAVGPDGSPRATVDGVPVGSLAPDGAAVGAAVGAGAGLGRGQELAQKAPGGDTSAPTLAKTDPDGHYRFAPLALGHYKLEVEHLGRLVTTVGPFEVRAGLVDVPAVRLEAGARLEFEALDSVGRPRAEALVVLMTPDGAALRRYTDHEGKLTLEPLPPGRYTVILAADGGLPEQRRDLELTGGLHRESLRADAPALPAAPLPGGGGGR